MTCSNGQTYLVNLGSVRNQASAGFIVGTEEVIVAKTLAIIVDGETVYSWDRGSAGFDGAELISCTGELVPDVVVLTLTGFIAPVAH
jgi:hypothetical protein